MLLEHPEGALDVSCHFLVPGGTHKKNGKSKNVSLTPQMFHLEANGTREEIRKWNLKLCLILLLHFLSTSFNRHGNYAKQLTLWVLTSEQVLHEFCDTCNIQCITKEIETNLVAHLIDSDDILNTGSTEQSRASYHSRQSEVCLSEAHFVTWTDRLLHSFQLQDLSKKSRKCIH